MKPILIAVTFALAGPAARAATSGQLKSTTDAYVSRLGEPTSDVVPYLSAELQHKHKFSKSARLQFKGSILGNPDAKSAPEKLFGDVAEAFVELKASDLKFRAGMDTVNWGVVDISSPSDVVNTSVLFHPLRSFKRGSPMLEAIWDRQAFGIHALYIPRQMPPVLPSVESRWLPRKVLVNISQFHTRLVLPPLIEYRFEPAETLNRALDHNAGVRFFSHLGSLDLQLTHFEGAAPSPKARPIDLVINTFPDSPDAFLETPVRIAPVIYRVRTSGIGLVWARETWILRAESAYQHTISSDPLLQPWSWASVIAAETNVNIGSGTMTWLAQFYYTRNPQAADNLVTSSYRLFDRTALLGARWAATDALTVTASALYEMNDRGVFWLAGFEQKLSDALKWGLSWRDFSAAREGLLKTYERNDHVTMDLTYYF